jgi:hypothetical protein
MLPVYLRFLDGMDAKSGCVDWARPVSMDTHSIRRTKASIIYTTKDRDSHRLG